MLSPTTKGGSVLYRRVIHPMLERHERVGSLLFCIPAEIVNFLFEQELPPLLWLLICG